ncbi:hypothetical protein M8C21_002374 [Ambrosia artemisiifolia]|uniref:Uncharacterized protein n=1 Tax=Ambrosia artemisiifolia TaxID=4212 RepID=A0AAD5BPK8_AMBAR|nr:hypothetical protein M8C21_002374 [Ambrosia artemisiifolia]
MVYAFSTLPRDLNFIDHANDSGWKSFKEQPVIVNPGPYMSERLMCFGSYRGEVCLQLLNYLQFLGGMNTNPSLK